MSDHEPTAWVWRAVKAVLPPSTLPTAAQRAIVEASVGGGLVAEQDHLGRVIAIRAAPARPRGLRGVRRLFTVLDEAEPNWSSIRSIPTIDLDVAAAAGDRDAAALCRWAERRPAGALGAEERLHEAALRGACGLPDA